MHAAESRRVSRCCRGEGHEARSPTSPTVSLRCQGKRDVIVDVASGRHLAPRYNTYCKPTAHATVIAAHFARGYPYRRSYGIGGSSKPNPRSPTSTRYTTLTLWFHVATMSKCGHVHRMFMFRDVDVVDLVWVCHCHVTRAYSCTLVATVRARPTAVRTAHVLADCTLLAQHVMLELLLHTCTRVK